MKPQWVGFLPLIITILLASYFTFKDWGKDGNGFADTNRFWGISAIVSWIMIVVLGVIWGFTK